MPLVACGLAQLCIDGLGSRFCCQLLHPFIEFRIGSHGQDYEPDELSDGDGAGIQREVRIDGGYQNELHEQ
jgi:hypothetical protein